MSGSNDTIVILNGEHDSKYAQDVQPNIKHKFESTGDDQKDVWPLYEEVSTCLSLPVIAAERSA